MLRVDGDHLLHDLAHPGWALHHAFRTGAVALCPAVLAHRHRIEADPLGHVVLIGDRLPNMGRRCVDRDPVFDAAGIGIGALVHGPRLESDQPVDQPRLCPHQLDREAVLVVDVDDAGAGEMERPPIRFRAERFDTLVDRVEVGFVACAECDIEDALVGHAVAVRPRFSDGIEVVHHLDEHLAAVEHPAVCGGTGQPPQRLVLWGVQSDVAGLEADAGFEIRCGIGQLGHRQRHRPDRRRAIAGARAC